MLGDVRSAALQRANMAYARDSDGQKNELLRLELTAWDTTCHKSKASNTGLVKIE